MHIKNAIYANDRSLLFMFWIFRGGIALMNLNHLAIFQAVAAVNSVSGGARRLNISQSAVSKQLAEFERSVGVSLFQRLPRRSEEHTSELQSLMRISYAVFCLKKKNNKYTNTHNKDTTNNIAI